jgi:putative protease
MTKPMRCPEGCGRPELLCPAGSPERLEAAVRFGADAVYLAGKELGMRSGAPNFSPEELAAAVTYAHGEGVRVYLACNSLLTNADCGRLPETLRSAERAGVDAVIATDFAVLAALKKYAPGLAVHISTQAGVTNWAAAEAFFRLGAKRVVLARELSLADIAEIRAKAPPELELEVFVHGSMCVSFSGRCLLSEYFTGRSANRGDCAQPCRWKYALMEETRPGRYFPVEEDGKGTYILNSRDLCMISHIPELVRAGAASLKIEGRAKSAYYTAVTAGAYRRAIDWNAEHPGEPLPGWIPEELNRISHRGYSTGFYFGAAPGEVYENGGYVRGWEEAAVCLGMRGSTAVLAQRNRFFRGDSVSVLEPGGEPYDLLLNDISDENGEPVEAANHAEMTVLARVPRPIAEHAILRRKIPQDD